MKTAKLFVFSQLGLRQDELVEEDYHWLDGTPFMYTNWGTGNCFNVEIENSSCLKCLLLWQILLTLHLIR